VFWHDSYPYVCNGWTACAAAASCPCLSRLIPSGKEIAAQMPYMRERRSSEELIHQPWMARFNTRQPQAFNFKECVVDPSGEHIKLFWRLSGNPVALISYDKRAGFCVQLFIEQFAGEIRPKMTHTTRVELQRCLLTSKTDDPWAAVPAPVSAGGRLSRFRWTWPPQKKPGVQKQKEEGAKNGKEERKEI